MNKRLNNSLSKSLILACGLLVCVGASMVSAQDFDFTRLAESAQKHTVVVKATVSMSMGSDPFDTKVRGMGLLVTQDGLVIVNSALIDFASGMPSYFGGSSGFDVFNLTVSSLDGKSYKAEWLGTDRFTGIGFIKISDDDAPSFKPIKFSTRKSYRIGEWVALFYLLPEFVQPPLGADVGMVTAILTEPDQAPLVIGFSPSQMNAALYDEKGRAIGILSEIAGAQTQSEYIDPAAQMNGGGGYPLLGVLSPEQLNSLIANPPEPGKKNRGWLGVSYQALSDEIAKYWGLEVEGGVIFNEVIKNSPAEKAGAKVGDVLYAINDKALKINRDENVGLFSRRIGEIGPGSSAELQVLRPDEQGKFHKLDLIAELSEPPMTAADAESYDDESFEFKARDMVFNDYLIFNLDEDEFSGVWVSEVQSGGWAELGGLYPGDIVQLVNGVEVGTVEEFEKEMQAITEARLDEVVFFVWRDNKTLFVNIKPNWSDDS